MITNTEGDMVELCSIIMAFLTICFSNILDSDSQKQIVRPSGHVKSLFGSL